MSDTIPTGLRVLAAIATSHSWSRFAHIRAVAGTKDEHAVQRRIDAGHVLQLPSGALHLTAAGRRLIRAAGVESAKCSKCRQQFERDAFVNPNRRQCHQCNPTVWSKGVRHAA